MIDESRTPLIAAVGQVIEREEQVTALDLAERAARAALDEAPGLAERIGQVSVVKIMSAVGPSPAGELSARLGLRPARVETTTIGGNTPQWLINRAAAEISAGHLDAALIVGSEAMRSAWAGRKGAGPGGRPPVAAAGSTAPDPVVGDDRPGVGQAEMGAGLVLPAHLYGLFESVRAAREGRSFAEHRLELGRLMAPFTEVASHNPNAWFPRGRDAEEIAAPSPYNRLVAEPYTKLMTAFLGVDQAAALIVCSLATARACGVSDGEVFVWSGADVNDVWFPAARPKLGSSPAIAEAAGAALGAAGLGAGDLSVLDLYSCFPVAVEIAAEAIGVAPDDPRGLTVTGGLPYFGGPGNNYVTHSVATLAERIRAEGGIGLASGMGWYVTKHSVGVYGSVPPPRGFRLVDTAEAQEQIDTSAIPLATAGGGDAIVEASTVVYEPDGTVSAVPVIARADDGSRVAAACADDREQLEAQAGSSLVGAKVRILEDVSRYRLTG